MTEVTHKCRRLLQVHERVEMADDRKRQLLILQVFVLHLRIWYRTGLLLLFFVDVVLMLEPRSCCSAGCCMCGFPWLCRGNQRGVGRILSPYNVRPHGAFVNCGFGGSIGQHHLLGFCM